MAEDSEDPQGDKETPASEERPSAETEAGRTLPSGARLQDTSSPASGSQRPRLSRRGFLTGLGVGALVVVAGGIGVGTYASRRREQEASASEDEDYTAEIPIVYGGDVCEAPLYAAFEEGFFTQQGLNVVLKKTGQSEDTHAAVGSGKYAAAPGIFFSWLKPIEQGQDVKLVAGLHEGCLRLVVAKDSPIKKVEDLKGKKIGVSGLQGSALNFFSLDLLDAGIAPNPEAGQVEWVVIDNDLLPKALTSGQVDAIAASDPIALLPTLDGTAVELTNNRMGANAQQFCCATAINGALVRDHPNVVRRLVTAWADGSRWVGDHPEETAQLEIDKNYVAGTDAGTVSSILKTYKFAPSAKRLKAALIPGIEKFAKTGFLDPDTDATVLADKVYADLGLSW